MSAQSYAHALISPFDEKGMGAQVPDLYVFPSDTTHFRTNFNLESDPNGNWDLIINPNLLHTVYNGNNGIAGSFPVVYPIQNNRRPGGTAAYGMLSDFSDIKQYRIVGMGFRMSSLLVPMTSTGTITMATLPTAEFVPDNTIMSYLSGIGSSLGSGTGNYNQNPVNQYATMLTGGYCDPGNANVSTVFNIIGSDGYVNPIIQTLPTGRQITHFEFNEGGIDWATRVIDSDALKWREITGNRMIWNGTSYIYNQDVMVGTSATSTGVQNVYPTTYAQPWGKDGFANGGFTQLLIRGNGFPASVNVANCELIFHVEIVNNKLTSLSSATIPPVMKGYLDDVLDTAAKFPFYRTIRGPDQRDMFSRLGITNL